MGQAFTLVCDPCFCGVVAGPGGNTMLPGALTEDASEAAVKQEEAVLPSKMFDAKLFAEPAPPETALCEPPAQASEKDAKQDCGSQEISGTSLTPVKVVQVKSIPEPGHEADQGAQQQPESAKVSAKVAEHEQRPLELPKRMGCLRRFIYAVAQQPEAKILLPFWFYGRCCQWACGIAMCLAFAGLGGLLLMQSAPLYEVKVPYTANTTEKAFSVDHDIEGDALIFYDLPGVSMNQKRFVESKDKRSVHTFMSTVVCTDADTREWARLRRAGDVNFLARIEAVPGDDLAPCGLVSMSMFSDEFTFDKSTASGWERLAVDETDIALPADSQMYEKKILESSGGENLTMDGARSWLTPGSFYEHWKVWYRTPVSPHVRNLWAVIRGGLKKGQYRVNFVENSPIWHDWGLSEKTLVFSQTHALGSKGAMECLGGVCLALAAAEALVLAISLVLCCAQNRQTRLSKAEIYAP